MLPAKKTQFIVLGPFCLLERELGGQVAEHKRVHGPLAPLRVIVPTHLLGLHLQRVLARHPALRQGHINIRLSTLEDFARELTSSFGLRHAPPLGLELLCQRIARDTIPTSGYFSPVRETRGFSAALLATFTDLKEASVSAGAFRTAAKTPKLKELSAAYAEFCDWLEKNHWVTDADILQKSEIRSSKFESFLYGFYDLNAVQRSFVKRLSPAAVFFPYAERHFDYAQPLLDWFNRLGYESQPITPSLHHSITPTILSAAGETSEVREAIREALTFVRDTRRTFNDVAIISRSREPYDPILRDTLVNLGFKTYFRGGRPLIEQPDAKLLLLLLETIRTTFSRSSVMELACHIGPHADWDALSVELGIVGGQQQWIDRVRAASAAPFRETEERDQAHQLLRQETARALLLFLQKFFATVGTVSPKNTWAELPERVLAAWAALGGKNEQVRNAVRALAVLDEFDSPVSFDQFTDVCARALQQGREQVEKFEGGGLFVGDVMGARGLSWSLVIMLGLVEKNFPRLVPEDPLLLDEERRVISPELPLKQRGHGEERLLFALTANASREKLVLSYSRLESGTARVRVPSFLLLDWVGARDFHALEAQARHAPLFPGRAANMQLDARELDLSVLQTLQRDCEKYLRELSPLLEAGWKANQNRWLQRALTAHDGLIQANAVRGLLNKRLGLKKITIGATSLEDFFKCPFFYFQRHLLESEKWSEPEATLAIDARDLGSLYHAILEAYFRGGPGGDLAAVADAKFREFEQRGVTGYPTIWKIKKEIILEELAAFVAQEQRQATAGWRPSFFEEKFEDFDVIPLICLHGKIDRIDLSADGCRARVLDYKTGSAPKNLRDDSLSKSTALQLPLYLLAAERIVPKAIADSASYVYFTLRGGFREIQFSRDALIANRKQLNHLLKTAALMIRAGVFAQFADNDVCKRCDFQSICGAGILRIYEGKQNAKPMADYRAIKESE